MHSQQPPTHQRDPSIECCDTQGIGLFLQSVWKDDRYGHTIGILIDGVLHQVLKSCEGTSENFWPPSPPLQQVHKQKVDENPVLLALGMAGTSHWSASFLLTHNDNIELTIEMACLPRKSDDLPDFDQQMLGVTYEVDNAFKIEHDANSSKDITICSTQRSAVKGGASPIGDFDPVF